ncbi:hypothetical protein [Pseudomonas fluorescens]|uniref:Uncharacterized protein n=1 Tax=Pseudomonas fluorescens TaxID=294 RepID=A0A0F4V6U6_PSEFL|nr:hypothetical protein [Pseudomonas fluorescens]KJZ64568.1 hypothetical protein VD17_16980 [Pseudomonas fluorescens]
MKNHELRSLQALRQLREQRAANQLLSGQQLCEEAECELSSAKARLHLHRDHLALEAHRLYADLAEGLPVTQWQAARARLDELTCDQSLLETATSDVTRKLAAYVREREGYRREHMARQRQCDAWDSLLDQRQSLDLRATEQRDDAEEGVSLPSAADSGAV